MKRAALRSIWFALCLLALSACAGATPEPTTITIDMTEYQFVPNSLELKVGQEVTLELVNSGQLQHEIMIGRDVMMMDNRPAGYQVDLFETGGVEPVVDTVEEGQMTEMEEEEEAYGGFMAIVGVGGRTTMTFTVTDDMVGEWEMGCFEQDGVHYDAGMHGPVTITR